MAINDRLKTRRLIKSACLRIPNFSRKNIKVKDFFSGDEWEMIKKRHYSGNCSVAEKTFSHGIGKTRREKKVILPSVKIDSTKNCADSIVMIAKIKDLFPSLIRL